VSVSEHISCTQAVSIWNAIQSNACNIILQVPGLQYPCVVKKGNVLYVILKDQATISLRHVEANNKRDQEGRLKN